MYLNYKYHKNKIYSTAIPITNHRKVTPETCIEHIYHDNDMKRQNRRIYKFKF